jgi:acetyl-CoA synthetase
MNHLYDSFFDVNKNQYNISYFCTKYQCELGNGDRTAVRWIFPDLSRRDLTFQEFEDGSNRCANLLSELGISEGDRVFTFLPKSPDVYHFFLGILKLQAVAGVLFSNFGEEALLDRLSDSEARILLTTKNFMRKVHAVWKDLPALEKVIIADIDAHESEKVLSLPVLMENASIEFTIPQTSPETPSVLHYTSGSTGKPKGVQHVHKSIINQVDTFRNILSVKDGDIFWCTADPGWVTGVSYGIIGPMSQGVTQIQFSGIYKARVWFDILQAEKVNIWYTAPTALRMLMLESDDVYKTYDLSHLRYIFSVGEPLNPSVIEWARRVLGKDIYDTWFQTETGAIMITNRPGMPIRPGSMGTPYHVEAVILDKKGEQLPNRTQGRLCLKPGWPSMFITYLNREEQYKVKFESGFYDTGDVATRDENGYFWFFGRGDDVINTSGHLVGPFEIESALLECDEVIEAGIIGAPDALVYEKVVAYIRLAIGVEWSREVELKLRLHVSNKLSSIATPNEFIVLDSVPKNKSGKIMRRLLKAWYTGEDVGDISTLEE